MLESEKSPFLKLFYKVQHEHFENKSYSLGKILTVVDACIQDSEQKKAVKDLMSQAYWLVNEKQIYRLKRIFSQFIGKFYPEIKMEDHELVFWEGVKPKIEENYFPEVN